MLLRRAEELALSLLTALAAVGQSCAAADPCSDAARPEQVARYERSHAVSLQRPMLGPDGIRLEVLVTASVTDRLAVWNRGPDWICIALTTQGSNARQCGVDGIAVKNGTGEFLFAEGHRVIRVLLRPEAAEVEVAADGCQSGYCAPGAAIESASYVRK